MSANTNANTIVSDANANVNSNENATSTNISSNEREDQSAMNIDVTTATATAATTTTTSAVNPILPPNVASTSTSTSTTAAPPIQYAGMKRPAQVAFGNNPDSPANSAPANLSGTVAGTPQSTTPVGQQHQQHQQQHQQLQLRSGTGNDMNTNTNTNTGAKSSVGIDTGTGTDIGTDIGTGSGMNTVAALPSSSPLLSSLTLTSSVTHEQAPLAPSSSSSSSSTADNNNNNGNGNGNTLMTPIPSAAHASTGTKATTTTTSTKQPNNNNPKEQTVTNTNNNTNNNNNNNNPKAGTVTQTKLQPLDRKNKNLSEKKIRRLEKNRLSARNCRRKKKEVTQNLQQQINIVEGQNLKLRLQLQIGQEAEQLSMEEQNRVTEGLDELLKSGASDSEIIVTIEEFKEKYADYGRDRRSAIDFHLRNVERLLMPTTTTTTVMRALDGEMNDTSASVSTSIATGSTSIATGSASGGYVSNVGSKPTLPEQTTSSPTNTNTNTPTPVAAPSKSLFKYLVNYLEVTPNQAAALKDSRHVAKELDSALVDSLSMLQELRERLTQCTDDLDAEFTTIRSILTPTQAAKFLVWVANNGACMHMLNELWRRQYPEPKVIDESGDCGVGDSLNEEEKDNIRTTSSESS